MTIAVANRTLNLLDGSVSRTFGSEPETRFAEVRVEDRGEDLLDGLLDQTVEHVWNAEQPLTAIRFGNRFSSGRSRTISAFQKLLSKLRPTWSEPVGEGFDRHTIGAGAPLLPRTLFHACSILASSTIFSIKETWFWSRDGCCVFAEVEFTLR